VKTKSKVEVGSASAVRKPSRRSEDRWNEMYAEWIRQIVMPTSTAKEISKSLGVGINIARIMLKPPELRSPLERTLMLDALRREWELENQRKGAASDAVDR